MNRHYLSTTTIVAGACIVAASASAQPEATEGAPSRDTVFFISNMAPVMSFGGVVDIVGPEGNVLGAIVAGKPYSADAITESTHLLADGNRITQRNETRLFRDGEGRTRREQRLTGVGQWATAREPVTIITINDPVADVSYFLDPVERIATQSRPFRLAAGAEATWDVAVPPPPAGEPGAANVTIMHDVRIGAGARGALPTFTSARAAMPMIPPFAAVTEDLGEQVLEGVLTRGTRQTQTIPAGTMGNERPIEIVAEQWYSAELDAVVQRRHYDPRFGENTYRLVNLVRGEPSPDLFAVPQGYELQVQGPPGPAFGMRGPVPPPGARAGQRVFLMPPAGADSTPRD